MTLIKEPSGNVFETHLETSLRLFEELVSDFPGNLSQNFQKPYLRTFWKLPALMLFQISLVTFLEHPVNSF